MFTYPFLFCGFFQSPTAKTPLTPLTPARTFALNMSNDVVPREKVPFGIGLLEGDSQNQNCACV